MSLVINPAKGLAELIPLKLFLGGFMPKKCIEFTLKRPVLRLLDKAILDWIFPEIKPFLPVTFAVAQLAIKKILLPDWLFVQMRPAAGCISSPELNPLF